MMQKTLFSDIHVKEKKPYNKGDKYEADVFNICSRKGLIPTDSKRAGADAEKADVVVNHLGSNYKIEVKDKNSRNPDYGQRRVHYDPKEKVWSWAKDDEVSQFYNELGLLNHIDRNINPIWYQKRQKNHKGRYFAVEEYTFADFKSDQATFEKSGIRIPVQTLFVYYKRRDTTM